MMPVRFQSFFVFTTMPGDNEIRYLSFSNIDNRFGPEILVPDTRNCSVGAVCFLNNLIYLFYVNRTTNRLYLKKFNSRIWLESEHFLNINVRAGSNCSGIVDSNQNLNLFFITPDNILRFIIFDGEKVINEGQVSAIQIQARNTPTCVNADNNILVVFNRDRTQEISVARSNDNFSSFFRLNYNLNIWNHFPQTVDRVSNIQLLSAPPILISFRNDIPASNIFDAITIEEPVNRAQNIAQLPRNSSMPSGSEFTANRLFMFWANTQNQLVFEERSTNDLHLISSNIIGMGDNTDIPQIVRAWIIS